MLQGFSATKCCLINMVQKRAPGSGCCCFKHVAMDVPLFLEEVMQMFFLKTSQPFYSFQELKRRDGHGAYNLAVTGEVWHQILQALSFPSYGGQIYPCSRQPSDNETSLQTLVQAENTMMLRQTTISIITSLQTSDQVQRIQSAFYQRLSTLEC